MRRRPLNAAAGTPLHTSFPASTFQDFRLESSESIVHALRLSSAFLMSTGVSSSSRWTWSSFCQPTPSLFTLIFLCSLLSSVHAQYFIVNQPSASTQWAIGSPFNFQWTKGLLDGIDTFDVELTRLRQDGLIYIAKDVPATFKSLNILLQDVPAGDDYFLLCLNSTHGVVYSVSPRFSITNSSSHSNPSPADPSVPTVTASGPPNPLKQFAATLGPSANAGNSLTLPSPNSRALSFGIIISLCAAFLGGVMTLW